MIVVTIFLAFMTVRWSPSEALVKVFLGLQTLLGLIFLNNLYFHLI